jgi:2-polyprenyl-3-methyl-5-hydroxy-6-metoxy-1,4-benzoquinol methylase
MTHPDLVRQHFDRHAPHYDNPLTSFIGERELRLIQKLVPPGSEVLDYGCGTGRTTLDLLRRGCRVTAFDISIKMLAIAETRAAQLGYPAEFHTDLNCLVGRKWPWVTCIGVFDYYLDPVPLLLSLSSFMSPDGRLVVTYPNALSPLGWSYALGSTFRMPIIPRTPRFVLRAARQSHLKVTHLSFAFPALSYIGLTLVVEMVKG